MRAQIPGDIPIRIHSVDRRLTGNIITAGRYMEPHGDKESPILLAWLRGVSTQAFKYGQVSTRRRLACSESTAF